MCENVQAAQVAMCQGRRWPVFVLPFDELLSIGGMIWMRSLYSPSKVLVEVMDALKGSNHSGPDILPSYNIPPSILLTPRFGRGTFRSSETICLSWVNILAFDSAVRYT